MENKYPGGAGELGQQSREGTHHACAGLRVLGPSTTKWDPKAAPLTPYQIQGPAAHAHQVSGMGWPGLALSSEAASSLPNATHFASGDITVPSSPGSRLVSASPSACVGALPTLGAVQQALRAWVWVSAGARPHLHSPVKVEGCSCLCFSGPSPTVGLGSLFSHPAGLQVLCHCGACGYL